MVAPLAMLQNMLSQVWLLNRNALLFVLGQRLLYLKRVSCVRRQYRTTCQTPASTSSITTLRAYIGRIQSARNCVKVARSGAPGCRNRQVSQASP